MDVKNIIVDNLLRLMYRILDEKNIIKGVSPVIEDDNLYIIFEKKYLSDTNNKILESIANIYCDDMFFSNDMVSFLSDKLEYWTPDSDFDEKYKVTQRVKDKKLFVLKLSLENKFRILGTTTILANTLRQQDPLSLDAYNNDDVIDSDLFKRQEKYYKNGCPDLKWIALSIFLDENNSLRDNPWANFVKHCEINSPIECDNLIDSVFIGYENKEYIEFCLDDKNLIKSIIDSKEEKDDIDISSLQLSEYQMKLLKS